MFLLILISIGISAVSLWGESKIPEEYRSPILHPVWDALRGALIVGAWIAPIATLVSGIIFKIVGWSPAVAWLLSTLLSYVGSFLVQLLSLV